MWSVPRLRAALAITSLITASCTTDGVSPTAVPIGSRAARQEADLIGIWSERFERGRGAPATVTRTISTQGFQAPFVLQVRTGGVSSATVTIDGVALLGPSDFNHRASSWDIPIALGATATVSVMIAGTPGSYIELSIAGARAATRFCPGGAAGSYSDFRAAIIATEPNGTIVVCDGDYTIDSVVVDKPITIRSEHSGMATLRDADPNPAIQGGRRPAFVVNGVESGTVRIVDLEFVIGGSVVLAGMLNPVNLGSLLTGVWDVVELDSLHVVGRTAPSFSTVSFAIRSLPSVVPNGGRMRVLRSRFEYLQTGVFAVSGVVDVSDSYFLHGDRPLIYSLPTGMPALAGRGVAERNVFDGCGAFGCIRLLGGGNITLRDNTISGGLLAIGPRIGAIVVGQTAFATAGEVHLIGNRILGSPKAGAPELADSYTDAAGIAVTTLHPYPISARENHIEGVFTGLNVTSGNPIVDAHDNTVRGGAYAVSATIPTRLTFTRNDAVDLARSMRGVAPAVGHYRCNWWGSAIGPVLPDPLIPGAAYTPWATQPIAGKPEVTC